MDGSRRRWRSCTLPQEGSLKVTTLFPFGRTIRQRFSKFLLRRILPICQDGKHDKKQRKNSCGGPASWHLLYRGDGRNHNVIGNSWNCPRASFGDLGLGTASRGQMAEAG